jgi:general secretion pathway protein A
MYERFFGLRERAFDLTPNPRFLLLTPAHREALANLQYGVASSQGLTLLTGEAGTGKTTVLRRALALQTEHGAGRAAWLYLNNPALRRGEFLEFLAEGFALSPEAGTSKVRLLRELEQVLRRRRSEGILSALVVDEAQCLPDELLEEIRLLANIESDTHKLLSIVLSGQPELAIRLNEWQFRHLKQRVALRCALCALTLAESAAYMAGRVRVAGGDPARLFSREAVIAVHSRARGIPRTINVICENALLTAFAAERPIVCADVVEQVARDFDLGPHGPAQPAAVAANDNAPQDAASFRPALAPPPPVTTGRLSAMMRLSQPRGDVR